MATFGIPLFEPRHSLDPSAIRGDRIRRGFVEILEDLNGFLDLDRRHRQFIIVKETQNLFQLVDQLLHGDIPLSQAS